MKLRVGTTSVLGVVWCLGACDPDLPPPGECWTDEDCSEGQTCEGAITCPEGAVCILPASPGTCEPGPESECWTDKDCNVGEICEGAVTCPEGAFCILPASPGTCAPRPGADCWTDEDCRKDETCEGAHPCPEGMFCILPATPGTCEPASSGTTSSASDVTSPADDDAEAWRGFVERRLSRAS